MIKATVFRNNDGKIYGFKIINHGASLVCACVSTLALNTINAIEIITDYDFFFDIEEDGGFLELTVTNLKQNKPAHDASVLLEALLIGLLGLEAEFGKDLKVIDNI